MAQITGPTVTTNNTPSAPNEESKAVAPVTADVQGETIGYPCPECKKL